MDGYYAWMIVATAFVLMMTTPALAFFYGGLTRSKSTLNMMMMSYLAMGAVGIAFVLWGWSEGGWAGSNPGYNNGKLIANPFHLFGLLNEVPANFIYVLFQLTFAVITAALISGSIADRVKKSAWLVFVVVWMTLVYAPIAHNVWGGGWLYTHFPNLDYAGGTVVHINAGVAGGVLALIIGKRVGFPKSVGRPHNVPSVLLGAGLLWTGWYGFNVGSIVFTSDSLDSLTKGGAAFSTQFQNETGVTFLNTTIATMAAMLGWMAMEKVLHKQATSVGAASGVVAGLVAITPSCGSVNTLGALCIGAIAGIVCAAAVGLKYKIGLDDSLDVVGVHLTGGIIGALLIGFFGTVKSPQGVDGLFPKGGGGLFYGGDATLLWHQFAGVAFTIVWCGVLTALIGLAIKYTIGWRVKPDEEVEGIDFNDLGETAYDWGASSSAIGGHLITEGVSA